MMCASGACGSASPDNESRLTETDSKQQLEQGSGRKQRTKRVRHRKPTRDTTYKCAVCDDLALGYNFNAITCESCKAFFRRNSASVSNPYECPNSRSCHINKSTRKHCPACRFDKCLRVGMKRDVVNIPGDAGPSLDSSLSNSDSEQVQDFKTEDKDDDTGLMQASVADLSQQPSDLLPISSASSQTATTSNANNTDNFSNLLSFFQQYADVMVQPLTTDGNTDEVPSGFGELLARRFFRLIKTQSDFISINSNDQFHLLQTNFISCHVINYGFVIDVLDESRSRLPSQLLRLHSAIRTRLAGDSCDWQILLAAMSMASLFSPNKIVEKVELDSRNRLLEVIFPIHYRFVRFLQQYVANVNDDGSQGDMYNWRFCVESIDQFRVLGEEVARTSSLGAELSDVVAELLYA